MWTALVILHRYLGVAVGFLMMLWCLSGFVMMYQAYPELTREERLGGLEALRFDRCCDLSAAALGDEAPVDDFRIEMLAGEPVLRLHEAGGAQRVYRLRTGRWLERLSSLQVLDQAQTYADGHGVSGEPRLVGRVLQDQWTLQTAARNQPAVRVQFDGPAGQEIYLSRATGEVFQDTTRRERVLAWMGAIPHWLYPRLLRQNPALWSQVVIWSALVGTFLTLTGLIVGVVRFVKRPDPKRPSPFRGMWLWHHLAGLVFGLLTLTWVASGLLTMNPWGLLESQGSGGLRAAYAGEISWGEVKRALATAPGLAAAEVVQIEGAAVGGRLHLLAVRRDGAFSRHDLDGRPALVRRVDVEASLARLGVPVRRLDRLAREDAYYYAHHRPVRLPVWRAILDDGESTRLYIDGSSGEIVRIADQAARQSRWLETAFHDFDWPVLRERPVWDVLVILLLTGVTLVCATGTWLAFQRVGRDAAALRRGSGRPGGDRTHDHSIKSRVLYR